MSAYKRLYVILGNLFSLAPQTRLKQVDLPRLFNNLSAQTWVSVACLCTRHFCEMDRMGPFHTDTVTLVWVTFYFRVMAYYRVGSNKHTKAPGFRNAKIPNAIRQTERRVILVTPHRSPDKKIEIDAGCFGASSRLNQTFLLRSNILGIAVHFYSAEKVTSTPTECNHKGRRNEEDTRLIVSESALLLYNRGIIQPVVCEIDSSWRCYTLVAMNFLCGTIYLRVCRRVCRSSSTTRNASKHVLIKTACGRLRCCIYTSNSDVDVRSSP